MSKAQHTPTHRFITAKGLNFGQMVQVLFAGSDRPLVEIECVLLAVADERDALQSQNEKMRKALSIIEHNAAELCNCIASHEANNQPFVQCDVCKTRAYTIAHAFGNCHDGCPVKQDGIKLVSLEVPSE